MPEITQKRICLVCLGNIYDRTHDFPKALVISAVGEKREQILYVAYADDVVQTVLIDGYTAEAAFYRQGDHIVDIGVHRDAHYLGAVCFYISAVDIIELEDVSYHLFLVAVDNVFFRGIDQLKNIFFRYLGKVLFGTGGMNSKPGRKHQNLCQRSQNGEGDPESSGCRIQFLAPGLADEEGHQYEQREEQQRQQN